jgi:membrane protein YqaA with SNARE-associated domain
MDYFTLGYFGLFLVCFLAATVLPFSSELVLAGFLLIGYDPFWCLVIATTGNTLGGITNYGIGYLGKIKWLLRLGVSKVQLSKMELRITNHGYWFAFFSWVPVVGDPLVIGLGYFKTPFFKVLLLVFIGKFFRYLLLVYFLN